MALVKCGECGKEISDKATACPGCGCPIKQPADYSKFGKEELWLKAYNFQYKGGIANLPDAVEIYGYIIEKFSDSPEAGYARKQLDIIEGKESQPAAKATTDKAVADSHNPSADMSYQGESNPIAIVSRQDAIPQAVSPTAQKTSNPEAAKPSPVQNKHIYVALLVLAVIGSSIFLAANKGSSLFDSSQKHIKLAEGYYNDRKFDKALDELNIATRLDPSSKHTYFLRGMVHLERKDVESALSDFKTGCADGPNKNGDMDACNQYLSMRMGMDVQGLYDKAIPH